MAEEEVRDVVLSFPEWQANTFAVDCTGKRAVLAVQKWLAVVNLDQPEDYSEPKAVRKLGRQNKYEIKAVLWNPHLVKEDLLASTCQQKLEVWNVNAERHPLVHSLKAHTRPVSDLSWSFSDPNLLASCAVDSYVHVWDIRDVKRPKTSFKAVAGASLVQWNRLNGNVLASAHDSDVRIWDMRKPTTASGYITAHMSRIHDLDWSHLVENQLTTCSHDSSIKFWDTHSSREPLSVIKAGAQPLWRARNYPSGHAVAMALVPAMHSGDSRVFLWSRMNIASPRHFFKGGSEPVLEVQWRRCGRDWDLVTWSKDRVLHIWPLGEELKMDLCGDYLGEDVGEDMIDPSFDLSGGHVDMSLSTEGDNVEHSSTNLDKSVSPMVTRSLREGQLAGSLPRSSPMKSMGSLPRNDSPVSLARTPSGPHVFQPQTAHTLAQEFSLLNLDNVTHLEIETKDVSERSCVVKVEMGGHVVRLQITFPSHYPNGAAPSFAFDSSTTIDNITQGELVKIITETANLCVRQNRPCLEQCLKKLTKSLETFVTRPPPPLKHLEFDVFGHLDDEHIPFPRASGARFCPTGRLVCFNSLSDVSLADAPKLPRSLDKLNQYRSRVRPSTRGGQVRWSGYLPSSTLPKRGSSGANLAALTSFSGSREKSTSNLPQGDKQVNPGLVNIYNAMPLFPINYGLAEAYSMNSTDLQELCTANASVAAQAGRMDLVQAWSTAMLIADTSLRSPLEANSQVPWPEHPFGRRLIHSLFNHFAKLHDIQTLAMLACLFLEHCAQFDNTTRMTLQSKKPAVVKVPIAHIKAHNGNHNHYSSMYKSLPPTRVSPTYRVHTQSPSVAMDRWSISGGTIGGGTIGGSTSPISSSWHEVDLEMEGEEHLVEEEDTHILKCRLLDDLLTRQCDEYCRAYANILYAWQLLDQRAEILKHRSSKQRQLDNQVGFASQCRKCSATVSNSPACQKSRCFSFTCSICNLAVRGSSNFCPSCGHGGHAGHMMDWFGKHPFCPTGCGCVCLESS